MDKLVVQLLLVFSLVVQPALWGQNLTVWHTENDPQTLVALEEIGKRFAQENPGTKVSFLSIGWDDLYRKLALATESKVYPNLTHIEPFMAAYFYDAGLLLPLDEVLADLGEDDIFSVVRDLQLYGGKRYGIAAALGVSYYSFRSDYQVETRPIPGDWQSFSSFVQQGLETPVAPVVLPANDLHITLLFTELLASNGGSLFDDQGRPDFTNDRVIETLEYWKSLYSVVPPEYKNSSYRDNLSLFARGDVFALPAFFGRGILQVERDAPEAVRTPDNYRLMPHILGPRGKIAYATLDAEPWVIFKDAANPELSKKFLRFFYRTDNYLLYTQSVPIHLTPIFRSLAHGEYRRTPIVQKWMPYYEYGLSMLDKGQVLPIFMSRPSDRLLPSLFKLEGTKVVSEMVRDVCQNGLTPAAAAGKAMAKAAELAPRQEPSSSETAAGETAGMGTKIALISFAILVVLVGLVLLFRRNR